MHCCRHIPTESPVWALGEFVRNAGLPLRDVEEYQLLLMDCGLAELLSLRIWSFGQALQMALWLQPHFLIYLCAACHRRWAEIGFECVFI